VPGKVPGKPGRASRPQIKVRCNLGLPSCRRWLSLKKRSLRAEKRRQARVSRK